MFSNLILLYNDNFFGGKDIPYTCAPIKLSHNESHDPLNPVWPVTTTFLSFQKELLILISNE